MDITKVNTAIQRLKAFEPDDGYYLCYSGGKDSDCIRILAELAGVKYELHHNLTTVDAPETVCYVKSIPGVIIDKATYKDGSPVTMWNLIVKKGMPPTRLVRYCCEVLKEHGGKGRLKITGVRWDESYARSQRSGLVQILGKPVATRKAADELGAEYSKPNPKSLVLNLDNDPSRRLVEHCYRTTATMLNPIIDWSDSDVWEFLHHYGCRSNPLYECGSNRVGCIGCPLQGAKRMVLEFSRYPKYKANYIRAFDRMVKVHSYADTSIYFTSGISVYKWWIGENPNQLSFFDED